MLRRAALFISLSSVVAVAGADQLNRNSNTARFRIEMHNITSGQWLSPILCALHDKDVKLFGNNHAPTAGQAIFAEDGFNGVWASELRKNPKVYSVLRGAAGLTPPDATRVEYIEGPASARLTCAAMPVTTNDVLTTTSNVRLPRHAGTSLTYNGREWNIGSEEDNYSADFMPLDSVNLVPEGNGNPVIISDHVVFGAGGRPASVPSILQFFKRAFVDATGNVTAEGVMRVFDSYEGSEAFPASQYGWTGPASVFTVTREN